MVLANTHYGITNREVLEANTCSYNWKSGHVKIDKVIFFS